MSLPLSVPFNQLCFGARFRYTAGSSTCWVKIDLNKIAEWDVSLRVSTDGWVGQRIRSFAENDDRKSLSAEVIVEPEKKVATTISRSRFFSVISVMGLV